MASPDPEVTLLPAQGADLSLRWHWADDHPRPTVLLRTPYGAHHHDGEAAHWHALGCHCVFSDVRGRYNSTGVFAPYENERADGELVARHVLSNPRCNGQLIAYGASYAAHCALEIAHTVPLSGLILLVPSLAAGCAANDGEGIYRLLSHTWWWHEHAYTRTPRGITLQQILSDHAALLRRPIADIPAALGLDVPGWAEAWDAPHTWQIPSQAAGLPLLICSGFFDAYLTDTVQVAQQWPGPVWCFIGQTDHHFRSPRGERGPWIGRALSDWTRAVLAGQAMERREKMQDQFGQWHPCPSADSRHHPHPVQITACGGQGVRMRAADSLFPSWQIPGLASAAERMARPDQCSVEIPWPVSVGTGLLCGDVVVRCSIDVVGGAVPSVPRDAVTFAHLLRADGGEPQWIASSWCRHHGGEAEWVFPAVCAKVAPGDTWILQWTASDFPVHGPLPPRDDQREYRLRDVRISAHYKEHDRGKQEEK